MTMLRGSKYEMHGLSNTRAYSSWTAMMHRCLNPLHDSYQYYGGRGITICDRWRDSFANFFQDMGERPATFTLERRDADVGYTPENCTWAPLTKQARNKRNTKWIMLNGVRYCLAELAEKFNINYCTAKTRSYAGWTAEQIITPPNIPL